MITDAELAEMPAAAHASDFIGSMALINALFETYREHIGITEHDGPDGPYIWCGCGWRSDTISSDTPGASYAIHLTNAQHAAAVKALQPIVIRKDATHTRLLDTIAELTETVAAVEGLADRLWADGQKSTKKRSYPQGVAYRSAALQLKAALSRSGQSGQQDNNEEQGEQA